MTMPFLTFTEIVSSLRIINYILAAGSVYVYKLIIKKLIIPVRRSEIFSISSNIHTLRFNWSLPGRENFKLLYF